MASSLVLFIRKVVLHGARGYILTASISVVFSFGGQQCTTLKSPASSILPGCALSTDIFFLFILFTSAQL
jgi:hypothetical protein